MALGVVGVSHHTAAVGVRERFAFSGGEVAVALRELHDRSDIDEAVLLSTCNRTEFYLYPAEPTAVRTAESVLQKKAGALPAPVTDFLYRHWGDDVARHLFRVTAGLDSLVRGEAEIQGQVKAAYLGALEPLEGPPLAGPVLNRLFQTALSVGGRVRSETPIGEGAASVASVAVELARKIFGALAGKQVLVLGAGEAGRLVAEALGREGVGGILVANRTYERAEELADRLCGRAVDLEELARTLREVDIVVASTAAPHAILTRRTLDEAFPDGVTESLLLIDIAVPRDVEPEVGDRPNIFLYNMDDLRRIVDETLDRRHEAVLEAERIIDEGTREFLAWFAALEVVPLIREIRSRAEAFRHEEIERLRSRLGSADPALLDEVESLSRRLLNKLLHEPTSRLRDAAADGRAVEIRDAARLLFDLPGAVPAEGVEPGTGSDPQPEVDEPDLGDADPEAGSGDDPTFQLHRDAYPE